MVRRWTIGYLALQGVATIVWWLLLWAEPAIRHYFKPPDYPDSALLSFWLADLAGVAAGSIGSAILLLRRHPRALVVLWVTTGGVVYGALYCLAVMLSTGSGQLSVVLMIPAAALTVAVARRESR